MIIGISGYAGSGKDTVGEMLQQLLQKEADTSMGMRTCDIKKFADPLREVVSTLLGISIDYTYTDMFKTSPIELPYYKSGTDQIMTGREFLQLIGTDLLRNQLSENVWVNALLAKYRPKNTWIITDVRFPNELKAVHEAGGIVIRIERPFIPKPNEIVEVYTFSDWHKGEYVKTTDGTHTVVIANKYRVESTRIRKSDLHISEIALDNTDQYSKFDHFIYNNGTLDQLKAHVLFFLESFNLKPTI